MSVRAHACRQIVVFTRIANKEVAFLAKTTCPCRSLTIQAFPLTRYPSFDVVIRAFEARKRSFRAARAQRKSALLSTVPSMGSAGTFDANLVELSFPHRWMSIKTNIVLYGSRQALATDGVSAVGIATGEPIVTIAGIDALLNIWFPEQLAVVVWTLPFLHVPVRLFSTNEKLALLAHKSMTARSATTLAAL